MILINSDYTYWRLFMRILHVYIVIIVFFLTAGILRAEEGLDDINDDYSSVRTWTSVRGQEIEAVFVKMENGIVSLEKKDGSAVCIYLNMLCSDDQEFVRESDSEEEDDGGGSDAGKERKVAAGLLSEREIKWLQTKWVDDRTGKELIFVADFGQRSFDSVEDRNLISRYVKFRKIPYYLSAQLVEHTVQPGKEEWKPQGGTIYFYILDPQTNVVCKKSLSASRMLSSNKHASPRYKYGYYGEVSEPGEYTAVIWVKDSKRGDFGKRIRVDLDYVKMP